MQTTLSPTNYLQHRLERDFVLRSGPSLPVENTQEDIDSVYERDPAARSTLEILTCYAGLHAVIGPPRGALAVGARPEDPGALAGAVYAPFTGIEIHPAPPLARASSSTTAWGS